MDDSFGPRLLGHFDFTLLFEDTIFHIVPASVIVFATLFFVDKIKRGSPLVRAGLLLWIKLGVAVALGAVQVATTVLWFQSPLNSRLSQGASIIAGISALCIGIIAYANHIYFIRPLPFLGLFLTITLLFDAATTRTYFLRTGLGSIARLHIAIPILKLIMLFLEEKSKRSLVIADDLRATLGSESFAGFYNTSLFLWINPIMLFGVRGRITTNFLPGIPREIDPIALHKDFVTIWAKADQGSKFALARACFYTMPWPYIYIILPRFLFIGFKFAQPFLLQDVVNAVSDKPENNDLRSGLILATAFIYVGMAFSRSWFLYIKNQLTTSTRAILVSAIYSKSIRLGKGESAEAAAVTLINTDVINIMQLLSLSYESWARVLEIILGTVILALFSGTASILSIIPTSLSSVFIFYISKTIAGTRTRWNNHIQNRVADTSNMLAQFKDIKMIGLAPNLAKRLQEQQVVESKLALADRRAVVSTFSVSAISETVTPVLVVACTMFWTRASEPISSARIFTTIAVVTMISSPLADILMGLPAWTGAFGALSRIQAYLRQEEVQDLREILPEENHPDSTSSTGVDRGNSAGLRNRQQKPPSNNSVKMTLLSVLASNSKSVLRDVSLVIPHGHTTMFAGPVGCGKSSLLRAIAGQVKLSAGSIAVRTKKIAYCAQKPWIRNTTIRGNVIGGNANNSVLYAQVLAVCALKQDLDNLPLGDETLCGSEGCKLSGGQKSRIVMARALYSEAEIMLLDDPFSALDMETSTTIRNRLFGKGGFLEGRNTTLIMTTSMRQHLVDADDAFRILEDGRVSPIPQSDLDALKLDAGPQVAPIPTQHSEGTQKETGKPPSVTSKTVGDDMNNMPETKFGDFSLYHYFASPAGTARVLLWGILVLVAAIVERMPIIFVRIWLDMDPQNRKYFAGYAAFGVLNPIMNWIACFGFFYLINAVAIESLHWKLADTTARATFSFLAAEDAGSLLNRFSSDTTVVSQRLPLTILPTTWGLLSVIIDVAVIASGASYAAPIMPVLLVFLFIVQHFYLKTSRQLRGLELDNSKLLVRQVTETSAGVEHVRSFNWEDAFELEFYEILEQTQKPIYFLGAAQQWLLSVLDLFSAGAGTVMVAIALNVPSSASANSMGLAFVSLITFSQTVSLFIQYFVSMEVTFGAVARIRAFAEQTPVEMDNNDGSDVPPNWPQDGKVNFNGVTAFYTMTADEGEKETAHKALDNVTIDVEPGSTLGLRGRTGSGKTSVLLALLRLVEYSGSITIDGREIKSVPRNILRTRITTITQSGIELRGSVRFNLNPFDDDCLPPNNILTDDMQLRVLEHVGLLTHINSCGGIDVNFMNMNFSEGQKQLFQLARAVLHKQIMNSRILLVDEGTSSVDEDTENRMCILIREFFASSTKIIISHRFNTLDDCDAVLNLQHGKGEVTKVDWGTQS